MTTADILMHLLIMFLGTLAIIACAIAAIKHSRLGKRQKATATIGTVFVAILFIGSVGLL